MNKEQVVAPPYRVIEGESVDLLNPFPESQLFRVWGWRKNFKNIIESDDSPRNRDEFLEHMKANLQNCFSYGIVNKAQPDANGVTLPLIGIIMFEPQLPFNGFLHMASRRKAYAERHTDEAVRLACQDIFAGLPTLTRISSLVHEKNAPAGALARRVGFKREGKMRQAIRQLGEPKDVFIYGLTRNADAVGA